MKQPEGNHTDDVFEKNYLTRAGAKDFGRLYEAKVAALLSLRCAKTFNMWMANNADEVGDFDDVLLFKEATKGRYIAYMIQLKHQETPKDLHPSDFSKKKDFNLSKYSKSFNELKVKIDNPTVNEAQTIKYLRAAHKTFFVLYTNKDVNSNECKFLSCCYDNDLLTPITSNSDRYYTFDHTQLKEYDPVFLNQLILLPNQSNVNDIDGVIRNEIRHLTRFLSLTDKSIYKISNEFVDFITKWAQSNLREQHFLTKRDITSKLVYLLLNPYIIKLSEPNLISHDFPQNCFFSEIITDKLLTILGGDNKSFNFLMQYIYSEVVKRCYKDVKNYECNLPQKSKKLLFKNYLNLKIQMIKILSNPEHITFLDVYTCMWLDNQLPLLLEIETQHQYKTIVKILELFGFNLRVILLNKATQPLPKIDTTIKRFEILEDLDEAHRDVLLHRQVKLQGRSLVLLGSLVDCSMYQHITATHIIHILLNDFNIGNVYESPSDYYIERRFYRALINPEVLKSISNELFLIEKSSQWNYNSLPIDKSKICTLDNTKNVNFNVTNVIIAEKHEDLESIQNNLSETSRKAIHWLKIYDPYHLEWKRSVGSTINLKAFELYNKEEDDNRRTYTIKDIAHQQNPTHILSASPGMGKSTLMNCLAHRAPKNMWILNINLNLHKKYYETKECQNSNTPGSTHVKYFNSEIFKQEQCSTELAEAIFKKFLNAKKILIILDGFDEISILHKREVTNIAKCLQREGYQMWLTTRPVVKSHLEEELHSIAMTLKPFTQDDQKTFLIKYFTKIHMSDEKNNSIIERFVKELLEAAAHNLQDAGYQFMGIPLQTKLLADAFSVECLKSLETNTIQFSKNFDLLDLYEKFITVKTDILYKKYSYWQEIIRLIANYKKVQSFCALKILFDENHLLNLSIEAEIIKFKDDVNEGAQMLLRDGIMVTENEFVHRTFAEYISAKWLADNLKSHDEKIKNTIVTLLNERFNFQHKFLFNIFDRIVSKNCSVRLNIISGRFEEAGNAIRALMNQTGSEDELGRSLLHLIALYGDYYTSETSKEYLTNINKDAESSAVNIAKLLLNDEKANMKEDKLGFNPLDYAIGSTLFAIANEICATSSNVNTKVNMSWQNVDRNTPLHYAASAGHVHLANFLISKGADIEIIGSIRETALHKAAENGFEQTVSLLLSAGANINKQNANNMTPLQCAAYKGHLGALNLLLERGADINILGFRGDTVLHDAAESGLQKIITLILSKGIDINKQNSENETPLHRAASKGHCDAVNLLLKKGADINMLDFIGSTVLHFAAASGSRKVISLLLSNGVDINKQNSENVTPLHMATWKGHIDAINLFLEKGADINILGYNGNTMLHEAAVNGYQKIITLLLSKGMEINKQNSENSTPLHLAASKGHFDAVNLLLEKGASINILGFNGNTVLHEAAECGSQKLITLLLSNNVKINQQNSNNWTPLHLAALKGHFEAVNVLLRNGADINILGINGETVLHKAAYGGSQKIITLFLSKGLEINKETSQNAIPLHFAAVNGHFEAVNLLLKKGADITILGLNGENVLHYAASGGSQKTIILLLSKGMEINKQNSKNDTPLHLAASKGHFDAVNALLEQGAHIDILGFNGNTVLHCAAANGSQKIITLLLSKGIEINTQNLQKATPLQFAAYKRHFDAVTVLLEQGADINAIDYNGKNVLHYAAASGSQKIIQLLLSKGMNINMQSLQKATPLQIAASDGHIDAVNLLVEKGADINMLDFDGTTVLHYAADGGFQKIIILLLSKGMNINKQNSQNATPLHLAASNGHVDAVNLLVGKGADINMLDSNGNSVLHYAIESGSEKLLTLFLSKGMAVNKKNSQNATPLHTASSNGHVHLVNFLISKAADIKIVDNYGDTALHKAAKNGFVQAISLLLTAGAQINTQNANYMTPLHCATCDGHTDAVNLLLLEGADTNIFDLNGNTVLHYAAASGVQEIITLLLSQNLEINKQNSKNVTPLHLAACNGHIDAVILLLENGADLNILDSDGNSVLHEAADSGSRQIITLLLSMGMEINKQNTQNSTALHRAAFNGHIDAVKLLLEKNADINIFDINSNTVLHDAATSGSQEIITLFLLKAMEINKQNSENVTPLQFAASHGHFDAVNLFLEKSADVNTLDIYGHTVLHYAADGGSQKIITLLLSKGVAINKQNLENVTPLHYAASKGHIDAVNLLLSNGADVSIANSIGDTVLHNAAREGFKEILLLILSKKANVNHQNNNGNTPLHCAAANGHLEVVRILVSYNADVNIANNAGETVQDVADNKGYRNIVDAITARKFNN